MSTITAKAAPRLHDAMARSIGADPDAPGIRTEIARRLGVDKSRYSRVMKGREVTLDKLLAWMRAWNAFHEDKEFKPVGFAYEGDDPVFSLADEAVE